MAHAEETSDPRELRLRNPYTKRQNLRRVAWWIVEFFLFKLSLRTMHRWRCWLLRMFGAKIGDTVNIHRTARIEFPWNLEIGRFSTIAEGAWIYNLDKVVIGDFVVISQRAFVCCGTHDYTRPDRPLVTKPVVIESGVWVAVDVFISPGVRIGNNSVIGARSVVTKDMPAEMVCAGHPCLPIKNRVPCIPEAT